MFHICQLSLNINLLIISFHFLYMSHSTECCHINYRYLLMDLLFELLKLLIKRASVRRKEKSFNISLN